jgi:hypothetical protein
MKNLTYSEKHKNNYQILMHKMNRYIHSTKSDSNSKENYTSYLKTAATREDKLSTQMGIKNVLTKEFKRHIHISTAPSITTSYLNIYLIDSIKNLVGIKKRVKNKVNYI